MSTIESFVDTAGAPHVRGMLHVPQLPSGDGLVLTHGAGGNHRSPLLVALAEMLAAAGVTVLRCDLPFRQLRPNGPPRGSDADDREGLRRALEVLRPRVSKRIFVGGQSYGGRQATMLLAEEPSLADGLLVLSYPLHPPGKPTQLRTQHLPELRVPCLFVSGTNDPFGSPEELKAAIGLIPGPVAVLTIDGAGHDLGYGRRPAKAMQDVPERIAREFLKNLR